jgi:hypothetical protein
MTHALPPPTAPPGYTWPPDPPDERRRPHRATASRFVSPERVSRAPQDGFRLCCPYCSGRLFGESFSPYGQMFLSRLQLRWESDL